MCVPIREVPQYVINIILIFSIAAFSSDSGHAALYELNVYTIENNKLIARNVQVRS